MGTWNHRIQRKIDILRSEIEELAESDEANHRNLLCARETVKRNTMSCSTTQTGRSLGFTPSVTPSLEITPAPPSPVPTPEPLELWRLSEGSVPEGKCVEI